MDYLYILGIVTLVLLFIIVLLILNSRTIENSLFTGFWKGDPDFCEQSETDLFLIYLGEPSLFSSTIPGYILVKNSDGLIMNNPFDLSLSGGYSLKPGLSGNKNYDVEFKWTDSQEEFEFFPSTQELCYYPSYGKIVLYKDTQVYAILYKDHQLSSINAQDLTPKSVLDESTLDESTLD
jgi:hypothetical protein